jgi:hypothetical protein
MINVIFCIIFFPVLNFAAETNIRESRQFRNIPSYAIVKSNYPFYNILNPYGPGTYAFGYEVFDQNSGNVQFKDEEKLQDGTVRGAHGVLLPDGQVIITKFVSDHEGYKPTIEKFYVDRNDPRPLMRPFIPSQGPMTLNDPTVDTMTPMHYSIGVPYAINDNVVLQDENNQNGFFNGFFNNLGQSIQSAFQGTNNNNNNQQSPFANLFKPVTNLFNSNQNNQPQPGIFSSFIQNLPFIGSNNQLNAPVVVEQIPAAVQADPLLVNNFYDEIPIIRPIGSHHSQNMQHVNTPPGLSPFSNQFRLPGMHLMNDPQHNSNNRRKGWLQNFIGRRRLHQQLDREIDESNSNKNKEVILVTPTPSSINN